jgi:hypothetical protein
MLPMTLAAESNKPSKAEVAPRVPPSGSIHIELPGRAVISCEMCERSGEIPDCHPWIAYGEMISKYPTIRLDS